jgi:hypothetical protein
MVMGSTKDLHGIDKGAYDNALAMPTLPKRNHKKLTFNFFCFYDSPADRSITNDEDFSIDPFKACEFGFDNTLQDGPTILLFCVWCTQDALIKIHYGR